MITLHSFKEATHGYREGRVPLRLLQDQAVALAGLCALPRSIEDALGITDVDIEHLMRMPEGEALYTELFAGDVHVCQGDADLTHIQGCDFEFAEAHGRWPNVTEAVMSWDVCRYLPEQSGEPQWAVFMNCWTDAGGPLYYVPRPLWITARVTEHIAATDGFWGMPTA